MNIIRLNSIGEPFAKSGQATPPSGGGSSVVYLNIEPVVSAAGNQFASVVKAFPGILAIKLVATDLTTIAPVSFIDPYYLDKTKAAAILPNFRGFIEQTNDINSNITIEQLKQLGATEITKEEFYTI